MAERTERFRRLDEPQKRGQATEAILKSEFLVRDLPVLVPEYDNEPYDLVVEVADAFYRVQCKTAYGTDTGTVQFETVSTRATATGYERRSYEGAIDFFAVYNPGDDQAYLVGVEEAASGKMEIRLEEPKNNQRARVNWYEEYLLDTRLERLRETGRLHRPT